MKKTIKVLAGAFILAACFSACSYGGVAVTSTDKAIVMRNDALLFGALRKAYVCQVSDAGLANCQTSENP